MKLLHGSFSRSLDSRCRLKLPVPFREVLGNVSLAIVPWRDCIELVPASYLDVFREQWIESKVGDHRLYGRLRGKRRASAEEPLPLVGQTQIGKDGRIKFPKPLALYLRAHGNEVLLIGHSNSFQVWDLVRFKDYLRRTHSWSADDEGALRAMGV